MIMIVNQRWIPPIWDSIGIVIITLTLSTIILLRVFYILHRSGKPLHPTTAKPLCTLIILGSGGHTAEMINLLLELQKDRFMPRYYVAAASDNMSLKIARILEESSSDEILCNGPGTCIPLCAIAFVFKVLGIGWSSIFYVESIARVKRLSLSGLLLYKLNMADQIYVQWLQLQRKYPRSVYVGCLM